MPIPPPSRIPSDAGVTFEGFEKIVIPSRGQVKDLLDSFLAAMEKAPGPMIRVILGWWGEGKTDAYGRYLKPNVARSGDLLVFVAASSIANSYERRDVSDTIEKTSLSALRFLVALLAAARDENPALGIGSVGGSPEDYVGNSLLKLATTNRATRKIVFFIDEFEELLLHPRLNDIISGLKEVVNPPQGPDSGVRQWLFDKGKLGGKVHFVLACTPDAYYRLESNAETALIFGGLERRQGVIELPPISRREGVRFLLDLLRYSYDGKLPDGLFVAPGIFDALARAAQLNLGNLVSLLARCLTSAAAQPDRTGLDYAAVVDALWNQTITAYGSHAKCIETDLVDRIERGLTQSSKMPDYVSRKFMRMMVGEPRPHRAEDLASRLGLTPKDIKRLINLLDETVRSVYGVGPATVRVVPVHVTEDVLRTEFREWIRIEGDTAQVKLDDYSETWDGFLDRISYLRTSESTDFEFFLPSDDQGVLACFEGISASLAQEIANKVRRLGETETYYVPSELLLQHVFPVAVPRQLDFIRDRRARLEVWRDVTRNLRSHFESSFAEALLGFLPFLNRFSVETKNEIGIRKNLQVFGLKDSRTNASVRGIIYCAPGDLTSAEVELVARHMGDMPPVHCAWVFHGGNILDEASRKIQDKGLGTSENGKLVLVRVHPTLAKLLLAAWLARKERPQEISVADLEESVSILLKEDLALEERWDQWISAQQGAGWFVGDMILNSASSPREAADALRFFVNYYPEPLTAKRALERNTTELARFVMYGSKMGLFPDIETDTKLGTVAEDLVSNGFLRREGEKFCVAFTQVEKRVLEVIERHKSVDEDSVNDYFVIGAKQKRILKDVYLPTLEYKGFIAREHGKVRRMTEQDWDARIKGRPLETLRVYCDRLGPYGHVFVSKQRDSKLIVLSEVLTFIDNLLRRRENESLETEDWASLRTSSLLVRLLDYCEGELLPLMVRASQAGDRLGQSLSTRAQEILIQIERAAKDALKWTKTRISPEAIDEYAQIKGLVEESSALATKQDPLALVRGVQSGLSKGEIEAFKFDSSEETASFFNLIVHRRRTLLSKLENLGTRSAKLLNEMARDFAEVEDRQKKIDRALNELQSSSGMATERFIGALGRFGGPGGDLPENELQKSDLSGLNEVVASILTQLNQQYLQLQNAVDLARNLIQAESALTQAAEIASRCIENARRLMPEVDATKITDAMKRIETNTQSSRARLASEPIPANLSELVSTMNRLVKVAQTATGQIREDTRAIGQEWRAFADRQIETLDRIVRVAEVVASRQKKVVPPKLQQAIDDLRAELVKDVERMVPDSGDIRSGQETVKRELALLASGFLSERALLVLLVITGGSSGRGAAWISLDELAEEVLRRFGIDRAVLEKLVAELRNNNIVMDGLALRG